MLGIPKYRIFKYYFVRKYNSFTCNEQIFCILLLLSGKHFSEIV